MNKSASNSSQHISYVFRAGTKNHHVHFLRRQLENSISARGIFLRAEYWGGCTMLPSSISFCRREKMPLIKPGFLVRPQPASAGPATSAWWESRAAERATGRKQLVSNAAFLFYFFIFLWGTIWLQIGLQLYAVTRRRRAPVAQQQYIPLLVMQFYNPACRLMDTSGGGKKEGGRQHFPLKKLYPHGMKEKKKKSQKRQTYQQWENESLRKPTDPLLLLFLHRQTPWWFSWKKRHLIIYMLLELMPSFFFLSTMGPHTKRASLVPQAARCQKTNRGVDDAYLKERGVNIQRGPSSEDTHALQNVETRYVPVEMRSVPRGKLNRTSCLPSFSPLFFFFLRRTRRPTSGGGHTR